MNLIERGAQLLKRGLETSAATEVTIVVGNESLENVTATPGTTYTQEDLFDAVAFTSRVFDWIIAAEDLVFPKTGLQEPTKSWEIHWRQEDGRTIVFAVLPLQGERVFDTVHQVDQSVMYRIHTKKDRVIPAGDHDQ